MKSDNDMMWSIYFNQQTPTVSVFRIYHIETHVTNIIICKNLNRFLNGVQDQNLLFTFLKNDYEAKFRQIALSELEIISHRQHLPPQFFSMSAFTLCTGSQYVSSDM